MEFEILTPLENLPATIEFNSAAIKKELSEKLEYYKGIEVTEDSLKEAKSDRAKLNALRTAVEDKRKAVKKACLAPYETFEKEVKPIVAMIDEPIQMIDAQTKALAQKEQDEKMGALRAYYDANIGDLALLAPLENILNPKWANKGETLISLTQEMYGKIQKIRNDLQIIQTIGAYTQQMQDVYLRGFDMSAALAEKKRLEEQAEVLKKVAPPAPATETASAPPEEPAPASGFQAPAAPEETKTIKVIFHNTTAAFRAEMRALTQKHNINYGGIA